MNIQSLKPRAVQLPVSKHWYVGFPTFKTKHGVNVEVLAISKTLDGAIQLAYNRLIEFQSKTKENKDESESES